MVSIIRRAFLTLIAVTTVFSSPLVFAQTNTFPSSGNVGIGTTSPADLLSLSKNQSTNSSINISNTDSSGFSSVIFNGSFTGNTGGSLQWNNAGGGAGNNLFLYTFGAKPLYLGTENTVRMTIAPTTGNVGIGTTSPPQTLSVVGTMGISESGGTCCRLVFTTGGSGTTINHKDNSPIFFQTEDTTWLTIKNGTGNVGIGTTNPSSKLDVNGNITGNGNIAAKYQDIAEWVPADQPSPTGTVVILNSEKTNSVIASKEAYDTRVAGVVSPNPGLILGEAATGKLKIATMGRVRVRVTTSNGEIRVGDLLVSSDRPGFAMRSEPLDLGGRKFHQPGTLIGKALEPLAEGEGEILVLLSLQ